MATNVGVFFAVLSLIAAIFAISLSFNTGKPDDNKQVASAVFSFLLTVLFVIASVLLLK